MDAAPNSLSLGFLEDLYEQYQQNPENVPVEYRRYFASFKGGNGAKRAAGQAYDSSGSAAAADCRDFAAIEIEKAQRLSAIQHRVDKLIRNIRVRGHMAARIDPLGHVNPEPPEITPYYYGLTEDDMDMPVYSERPTPDGKPLTVRKLISRMRNTYMRYIGAQFMHIDDLAVREWLQKRMEGTENRIKLDREQQVRIFTRLTDAVIFEEFIQKKYLGAKSFSLEGGETLIPLLELGIEKAGELGIEEILIGMPHHGRLNVLCNIMGKAPRRIFREFEDKETERFIGRGDVKYHQGYHSDWITAKDQRVHLSLAFNPSHLEFVNSVVEGRLRARHDREDDVFGSKGIAFLMHGDAAFAGEGIVQETLNLSELEGYSTGGAIHIVVNNQIGFTTNPSDARSSVYATDVAKMLQSPIFHVNGEEPESVAQVINLALEFRMAFRRDVVIDMYCYRKRGHNEGDEPTFTQPLMYSEIAKRRSVREGYLQHMLKLGGITREEAEEITENRRKLLEAELDVARSDAKIPPWDADDPNDPKQQGRPKNRLRQIWKTYVGGHEEEVPEVPTGLPVSQLQEILKTLTTVPEDFRLNPKLQRFVENRAEMLRGERPLDWATAEALAMASLALEGRRVRLSGQDCQRGTFTQRHSVWHDTQTGRQYMALKHLAPNQGPIDIYNSPLTETAVLGFEYGYSVGAPDGLVMWEAQFGDFANVAQTIIDQFIASGEDKWQRLTGLVLLLPHGLEGTGPEHASARLERFLTLAAEDNMQVAQPSTPANFFHLLRRQVLRPWRKPLVVMTPKSMLRNPDCASQLEDLEHGEFTRIIGDPGVEPANVKRILMCSGKVYYDLEARRKKMDRNDVAILRLEMLFPLKEQHLVQALGKYAPGTPVWWVQEEPENGGAWRYLFATQGPALLGRYPLSVVSRPPNASPATGSHNAHKIEQEQVVSGAFAELPQAVRPAQPAQSPA